METESQPLNLLQELDTLCSKEQGDPLELERKLAAWVLLVRLDTDTLEQVWNQHGSLLQQFAMDILLEQETMDSFAPTDSPLHTMDSVLLPRYLRILSQVTTRVSPYPFDLAQRILQLWIQLPVQDLTIPVHVDIISTLEVFLFTHPARANTLSLLNLIWQQYERITNHHVANHQEGCVASKSPKNEKANSVMSNCETTNEDTSSEIQELNIMAQTLDGILDGASIATINNNDNMKPESDYSFRKYSIRSLHELILGIFSQEGVEDLIPVTLVASLVEFITTPPPSLDPALKVSWNEWFLTWIATRCNPSARPFHQVLLDSPKFHRMLLSLVIAPPIPSSQGDSTLRAMAWQALVTLVEINDWNWMITSSQHLPTTTTPSTISVDGSTTVPPIVPSTSSLGRATLLCTWIRLASGELRIQLQSLLLPMVSNDAANTDKTDITTAAANQSKEPPQHSHHHHHHPSSSTQGGWQATALPVGHGCARLLQSVVRYLIRLADQPHIPMPLEGDALWHLRQSLEQALWTAVEYLSITAASSSSSSSETNLLDPLSFSLSSPSSLHKNDRASLFHAILRLLGTLLMEVDIFDLLHKATSDQINTDTHDPSHDNDDSNASPIVILTCLKDVLPIAEDPSLLPGLVHIMGDAEDDLAKQELLRTHLTHPLLEYLDWYWQREPAVTLLDDSVAWACTCTELWAQLLQSSSSVGPLSQEEQDNALQSSTLLSVPSSTNLQQQQQDRRRLCLTLLTWIQDMLFLLQATGATTTTTTTTTPSTTAKNTHDNNYPSSLNYLSLALGCYMTLSKDRFEPPTEHETRLILRALQRCERS